MNHQNIRQSSRPRSVRWINGPRWLAIIVMAGLLLTLSGYMLLAAQTPELATTALNGNTLTKEGLANKLVGTGGGVTISNVVYTGTNAAAGIFSGGSGIVGFEDGIILSTGHITGVVGPNSANTASHDATTAGDPQLNTLTGKTTHNAAVLTFDFIPQGDEIFFDYVFSSEEYNEYVNSEYNDVFAFYVNGTNCAVVPSSGKPVSINSINKGKSGADTDQNASHPELFRNNTAAEDGSYPINTGMNGLTTVLNCKATVTPNVTNTMKLVIADSSDQTLDSNVFIKAGSLTIFTPTPLPPTPTSEPTAIPTSKPGTNDHGDVHIRTPDGLVYDFQEVGDFILLQSTSGDVMLQARQSPLGPNGRVSINTAVAMNVAGDTLEFYLKPERGFYLNGERLDDLPTTARTLNAGGEIVLNPPANASQQDFTVVWPDRSTGVRVILYGDNHLDIGIARFGGSLTYEGILGNLDKNRQNDVRTRDGEAIEPLPTFAELKRFGDSWRVQEGESLFRAVPATQETVADEATVAEGQLTVRDLDPAVVEGARQICEGAGITDPLALDTCTYDVAVTGDEIFVESAQAVEESIAVLSPCERVPAQYESLGAIFNAGQDGEGAITMMDGDDLQVAIDELANGTRYLRFNIYRDAVCIASFSAGADTEVADALAGAMAVDADGSEIGEPDARRCREGLAILQGELALAEDPAEWLAFYAEIEQEFLVGCVGLDDAIAEAAAELDVAELVAELGIAESDLALLDLFSDGPTDSLTGTLTYANGLVSTHCPESAEGVACSDILAGYDVYLRLAGALLDYMND